MKTQSELGGKKQAIEEEKTQMRKQIEEMKALCDLKEKKDWLSQEVASQEIRVGQMKKLYGRTLKT